MFLVACIDEIRDSHEVASSNNNISTSTLSDDCLLLATYSESSLTRENNRFNPLFTHDALGQHKFDPIHLST